MARLDLRAHHAASFQSSQAAHVQAKRIAAARGMSQDAVLKLIDDNTDGPLMGLFGTSTINVLELNLALDALK